MQKLTLATLVLVLATACAGSGVGDASVVGRAPGAVKAGLGVAVSTSTAANGGAHGGNLVTSMDQIVISVVAVAAHAAGSGWVQVSDQPTLVDLLRLQDSADALGFAHLPAGKITQIRLYITDDGNNRVVTKAGETQALTVPSGLETGVKLKGPFDLGACENGLATAVVDLEKSILVHGHGNHEDLILRPTIHRTDFDTIPADICDPDGDDGTPVPGGDDGSVDNGGDVGGDNGGDGGAGACPPGTEGCGGNGGVTGGTDGTGGTGTGDGSGATGGTDGTGGTGTGDGSGATGGTDGTGGTGTGDGSGATGGTDGTGGTGTGDGTTGGTGSTGGTCDAPVFVEGVGLICP